MTHDELTIRVPTSKISDNIDAIFDGAHDIREIEATLLHFFGGFERTEGFGGWRDDDGIEHREAVTIWTCLTDDPDGFGSLRGYAAWLAWKLGEQCVLVRRAVVEAAFVEPCV